MPSDLQAELDAIRTVIEALEPLEPDTRSSVIEYVLRKLKIAEPAAAAKFEPTDLQPPDARSGTTRVFDIQSLREEKSPQTASQMIAVVAYYLAHLAPDSERQAFITTNEIDKYFVQGRYPLPKSKSQALVDAKNAGYLDFVEKGKYRLNSVGHNLVAHKLPSEANQLPKVSRKAKKQAPNRKTGNSRLRKRQ